MGARIVRLVWLLAGLAWTAAGVSEAVAQKESAPASLGDTATSARIATLIAELKAIVGAQPPKGLSAHELNEIATVDTFVSRMIAELEAAQQRMEETSAAILDLSAKADAEQRKFALVSAVAKGRLATATQAINNVR